MPDSSSTMRMLCMLANGGSGNRFSGNGQFHYEPCSHRFVFFDPNRAVVIFNDATDDSQAQSSSALLGGKVRQEKAFFQLLGNAVASVGYGDFDGVPAGHQRRGDLNFANQRAVHGLGCIVYKVGQRAFDGLGISHDFGKIDSQEYLHMNAVQPPVEQGQSIFNDGVDVRGSRLRRGKAGQSREFIDQDRKSTRLNSSHPSISY